MLYVTERSTSSRRRAEASRGRKEAPRRRAPSPIRTRTKARGGRGKEKGGRGRSETRRGVELLLRNSTSNRPPSPPLRPLSLSLFKPSSLRLLNLLPSLVFILL